MGKNTVEIRLSIHHSPPARSQPRARRWLLAIQPSAADCPRWKAISWLSSQVLVFGSWEEREHGPSHSPGTRCLPSWVVLALPPSAKTAHVSARMRRHTQTHTACVCSLLEGGTRDATQTLTQTHPPPQLLVSTPDEDRKAGPWTHSRPTHTHPATRRV